MLMPPSRSFARAIPLFAAHEWVALKRFKRSHDTQQQVRHRRALSSKGQVLLLKTDVHTAW